MLKLMSTDFLGHFWSIIIFVFLGLTFSIHVLQYEERVFKQFCNPVYSLVQHVFAILGITVQYITTIQETNFFSCKLHPI